MVKEVEFSNYIEIAKADEVLAPGDSIPMLEGAISQDGMTLQLQINSTAPNSAVGVRKVMFYYKNIDFEALQYERYELLSAAPTSCSTANSAKTKVEVDLTPVTKIPKKIYNIGATTEIVVELYTYEANITTEYGSKILSVPYTVEGDEGKVYDKSTDGLYELVVVDIPVWASGTTYGTGDVMIYYDDIYVALRDNIIDAPLQVPDDPNWVTATDSDIENFAAGFTPNPPLKAVKSDVLISHYAKQQMIMPAIKKMSYKDYDNESTAVVVNNMQNIRELAKEELYNHKPINAANILQKIYIAEQMLEKPPAEVRYYNIRLTL